MTEIIRGAPSRGTPTSWVVRRKDTGAVVTEIFSASAVAKLNTAKYEAVPILAYLQSVNGHQK